ncbi:hypothetical protein N7540_004902 [Penicillium herquei]|nr:hypothetical protein N7540_004902 [Penicillium herquei]
MYCKHRATVQHDRVYALLGLCSDAQSAALQPDYNLPWHDVLKNVLSHIFPECSIEIWKDMTPIVVQGKGRIIGHVHSVAQKTSLYLGQHITVVFNKVAQSLGYQKLWVDEWRIQPTADLVREGDVITLFQGASKPCIVRLCNDHFTVISAAVMPQQLGGEKANVTPKKEHDVTGLRDMLLTWSFHSVDAESKPEESRQNLIEKVPGFRESPSGPQSRSNQIVSVIVDIAVGTERDLEERSKSKALKQILDQSEICAPIIEMFRIAAQDRGLFGNALIEVLAQQRDESGVVSEEVAEQEQGLSVPEQVIQAAAANTGEYSREIVECLCEQQCLVLSEEVLKTAAANIGNYAPGIMTLLLKRQERDHGLPVSEEVLKLAAGNTGNYAYELMTLLLDRRGRALLVSEEVLKAAASNTGDDAPEIMTLLLKRQERDHGLPVSEEVLKLAAGNTSNYAHKLMSAILERRERALLVSEEVLKAAASNTGDDAPKIMTILLKRREPDHGLLVSEEVLKLAAENTGDCASEIMTVLLKWRERTSLISQEVLKAAAANTGNFGFKIVDTILAERESLVVSEEVVKEAAKNPDWRRMFDVLFERRGESVPLTKEVVKAAAGNIRADKQLGLMEALYQRRKYLSFPVLHWESD